jgi:hypothetical protein
MADIPEAGHEAEAELRLSRVKALDQRALVAVLTYLLARHPETFPPMLDDALSATGPLDRSEQRHSADAI